MYIFRDPPVEVKSFEQLCEEFIVSDISVPLNQNFKPFYFWAQRRRMDMFKEKSRKWAAMRQDLTNVQSQKRREFMAFTPDEERQVTPFLDVVCVDFTPPEDIRVLLIKISSVYNFFSLQIQKTSKTKKEEKSSKKQKQESGRSVIKSSSLQQRDSTQSPRIRKNSPGDLIVFLCPFISISKIP